jgi:hypothetical protein
LLAHPEWRSEIKELKAIEPSAGMRESFAASTQDERVIVQDGTFEQTNVPDGWADLVVVAQVRMKPITVAILFARLETT